jgi:DNA-directed RNA polymerase subunit RPC12/RpoP
MPKIPEIAVQGIWLRYIEGKAQVLAEVSGKWRLLMEESLTDGNPTFSHICEPSGISSSPLDPLTSYEKDMINLIDSMQRCSNCGSKELRDFQKSLDSDSCHECGRRWLQKVEASRRPK